MVANSLPVLTDWENLDDIVYDVTAQVIRMGISSGKEHEVIGVITVTCSGVFFAKVISDYPLIPREALFDANMLDVLLECPDDSDLLQKLDKSGQFTHLKDFDTMTVHFPENQGPKHIVAKSAFISGEWLCMSYDVQEEQLPWEEWKRRGWEPA